MVRITELLPLLDGWKREFKYLKDFTLQAGQEHREEWNKLGWIVDMIFVSNNPLTQVEHNVYITPSNWTFYDIYYLGGWIKSDRMLFLRRYDTLNDVYVMSYEPEPPQEFTPKCPGGQQEIYTSMRAPSDAAVVISMLHNVILVTDEKKFRKSLERLRVEGV